VPATKTGQIPTLSLSSSWQVCAAKMRYYAQLMGVFFWRGLEFYALSTHLNFD
jgi:hypothetical protein